MMNECVRDGGPERKGERCVYLYRQLFKAHAIGTIAHRPRARDQCVFEDRQMAQAVSGGRYLGLVGAEQLAQVVGSPMRLEGRVKAYAFATTHGAFQRSPVSGEMI